MSEPQDSRTLSEDHPAALYPSVCPICKAKVIRHCPDCETPVTACTCSLRRVAVREIGEDGLAELEDESRKDRLRQQGVWVPE